MWNQISDRLNWYWYFRADYYCYFILLLSTNNPWTTLILKSHLLIGFLDGSEQRWGFDRCWRNQLQSILTFHFSDQTKYFFLFGHIHILAISSYCLQYLSTTSDGLNSLVKCLSALDRTFFTRAIRSKHSSAQFSISFSRLKRNSCITRWLVWYPG